MPPHFRPVLILLLPVALAGPGCAAARQQVACPHAVSFSGQGAVFAVDGAGGFEAMSSSVRQAVAAEGLPLSVETFPWTHGYGRVLADEMDRDHAVAAGQRLAGLVLARRQGCPGAEVYLVGHSAGCGVVLAAVEALPPGAVDRVMLLSPAVSAEYDLRPALRGVRRGVDVFYSPRDRVYLGVGTALFGTADRCWGCAAAGRVGFRTPPVPPEDVGLFYRLRQHPWHPSLEWSGNHGGHYGTYQVGYLRAYVLPLMVER